MNRFSAFDLLLLALAILIAWLMLRPRVRDAAFWQATVTPLASIIGSGFLVVVPLLASIAGTWSLLAITVIVLLSFAMGAAMRYTIRHDGAEGPGTDRPASHALGRLSHLALALAYVISITFYIRLLAGFVLTGAHAYSPMLADSVATAVLAFIGLYGLWRGLHGLERLEEYSVTLKLAVIASLLVGLAAHDARTGFDLAGLAAPTADTGALLRQLGGMLLIVQGFETSKYLGKSYDDAMKCRTMRFAQVLAGLVYVGFVALSMPLMAPFADADPSETAIIDLAGRITYALPMMLVLAAAMSQFSAAIADTIGAGGVVEQETSRRFPARHTYPVAAGLAVALIWTSDIFQVIALASRAFAFYYMLQAIQAALRSLACEQGWRKWLLTGGFVSLALLLALVVVFATPAGA